MVAVLGYLGTLLMGLPVAILATAAGLSVFDPDNAVERGAFVRYDLWSWAAEACVGLLAVGLTALVVGYVIRTRTGCARASSSVSRAPWSTTS